MKKGIEVEVKIRLETRKDYDVVKQHLTSLVPPKRIEKQTNFYFDGGKQEMYGSNRSNWYLIVQFLRKISVQNSLCER